MPKILKILQNANDDDGYNDNNDDDGDDDNDDEHDDDHDHYCDDVDDNNDDNDDNDDEPYDDHDHDHDYDYYDNNGDEDDDDDDHDHDHDVVRYPVEPAGGDDGAAPRGPHDEHHQPAAPQPLLLQPPHLLPRQTNLRHNIAKRELNIIFERK